MKVLFTLVLAFTISFLLRAQNEALNVEGPLVVGNTNSPDPTPGCIRWTGWDFEAYNGTDWVSLTDGRTAPAYDPDGNEYKTIKIGNQIWFTENLRTTKYADGSSINFVTDNTQWANASSGAYCWYQNNNIHETPEGKLYNWYAASDNRNLCPEGFRVPTVSDFNTLIDYLGGTDVAGGQLKQKGFTTWKDPNEGATDAVGFTAVAAGTRFYYGPFSGFPDDNALLWTRDEEDDFKAFRVVLQYYHDNAVINSQSKKEGQSVRCVR